MHLPSYRYSPRHLSGKSAWVRHLPFGYDLVALLRPSVVVELGTWCGDSFFTFCQAVDQENVPATCYAVDHWQGDDQTGPAGFEMFEAVQQHCVQHYQSFAYLMRSDFASAAHEFASGSIDLLHIDGFHSYESCRQDFETWFPLVREGGVILFHDIQVRSSLDLCDFGVWKLWEELKKDHHTCEFRHGFGLGILFKGQPPSNVIGWLAPSNFQQLASYYETRGAEIERNAAKKAVDEELWLLRQRHQALVERFEKQSVAMSAMMRPDERMALKKQVQEAKRQNKKMSKIIESALAWQQGSWFKRAFHKWRAAGSWKSGPPPS